MILYVFKMKIKGKIKCILNNKLPPQTALCSLGRYFVVKYININKKIKILNMQDMI